MATNDITIIQEQADGELIERNVAVTPGQVLGFNESGLPVSVAGGGAETDPIFSAWFDSVKPAVPAGLSATPISGVRINLAWSAATNATGYKVYRDGTLIASPTGTSYSSTGLTAETEYSYTVSATNTYGESAQCAAVLATTLEAGSGYALQFDGSQNYASVAAAIAFYPAALTVEGSVKLTGSISTYTQLIGNRDDGDSTGWNLVLYPYGGVHIASAAYTSGGDVQLDAEVDTSSGWHHFAFVINDSTHTLYWDGVSVASSGGSTVNSGSHDLQVGGGRAGCDVLPGCIDNIRISSVARYSGTFTPPTSLTSDADTIALWLCDEGSGTTSADASGNGHDLTLYGDPLPLWVSRADDKALQFDGIQNGADVPNTDGVFDFDTSFTFEFWCNPVAASGSVLVHCSDTGEAPVWGIWLNDYPYGIGYVQEAAGNVYVQDPLPTGVWSHVAVTHNGSTVTVWLNGVAAGSGSFPLPLARPDVPLRFGYTRPSDWYSFSGSVDEVRVSNVVRYSDTFVPATSFSVDANTIGYWKMDSGGDTVPDESGNGHTLTLIGSPKPYYADGVTV